MENYQLSVIVIIVEDFAVVNFLLVRRPYNLISWFFEPDFFFLEMGLSQEIAMLVVDIHFKVLYKL